MIPEEMEAHGRDYRRLLIAFRDGRVNLEKARTSTRINADLDEILLA
jgi:hypothetical protein